MRDHAAHTGGCRSDSGEAAEIRPRGGTRGFADYCGCAEARGRGAVCVDESLRRRQAQREDIVDFARGDARRRRDEYRKNFLRPSIMQRGIFGRGAVAKAAGMERRRSSPACASCTARAGDRCGRLLCSGRTIFAGLHAAHDCDSGAGSRRAGNRRGKPSARRCNCWLRRSRLGIDSVARVGGAQAIAALAYGTKSIHRGGQDLRTGQSLCDGGEARW